MKYLLITVVIGSQTINYEISNNYIYQYTLDSNMKDSYLIDRINDTLFIFNGRRITSVQKAPNEKNLGWSPGYEEVLSYEVLKDSFLGSYLKLNIAKHLSDYSYPSKMDKSYSTVSKSFISKNHKFIDKYFYIGDELEYRILSWNIYKNSEDFPFLIRTEQSKNIDADTFKILDVRFEEKTIDTTYRTNKILTIVKNKS